MAAGGVGGALARGLESGFGMGMEQSRFDEQKRRAQVEESRQTALDVRSQAREDRLQQEQSWNQQVQAAGLENTLAQQELGEVVGRAKAAQETGTGLTPELAQQYGAARTRADAVRQQYRDLLSKVQTGRVNPMGPQVSPRDFAAMVQMNTGYHADELKLLPEATENLRSGMSTGNMGLALQGANVLLGPVLRRGIGEESPHGGTIVRKQIVNAVPAQDANGVLHPDKVFPVVRVFVNRPGPDGQGVTLYYDAPLTKNGTADPGDAPVPVSLSRLTDYMGNAGTLAAALQHPEAAAKFEAGRKEAGGEIDRWLAELGQAAPKPKPKIEKLTPGQQMVTVDPVTGETKVVASVEPKKGYLQQKLDAVDDLGLPEDQADRIKQDILLGAKGKLSNPELRTKSKGGGTGVSSGAAAAPLSADPDHQAAVDYWADLLARGGSLPAGFQKSNKQLYADILKRVPQVSGGAGEMMSNKAEYGGVTAGQRTAGQRSANFGLAKAEAYEMADLVTEASARVGRTDFIPVNRALLAAQKNTGDPEVVKFGAAINSFINAYARAVSPVGTPTVSDKNHAREMLEAAQSHEQVQATIGQLKREMQAAGNAPKTVRQELRDAAAGIRTTPRGTGLGGAQPAPQGAPAPTQTATNPRTGERLQFVNGQWVPLR